MATNRDKLLQIFVYLIILCLSGRVTDASKTCEQTQQPISKIINLMSNQLARQIEGIENYFYSPLSISVALAMVYMGAKGNTGNEISNTLQYKLIGEGRPKEISESFNELITSLGKNTDDYTLKVANGVLIQTGYAVLPNFTTSLESYFNAVVGNLDFAHSPEQSMQAINQWVESQTNGMIKNILNEPLDTMTIMIIMNAIYFKGVWTHQFNERATWGNIFRSASGVSKLVPFMMQQEEHRFYFDKQTNYSYLEMDYVGDDISMLLILPEGVNDFPNIDLTNEKLCDIRSNLEPREVTIALPKFRMAYKRELTKDMTKLGIRQLFSDRADLTGIRDGKDLHVSLMLHKALIDVNERGSEASGITGIGIDARKKQTDIVHFWADHPFLFCILHKKSGSILFMGRVSDPER